MRKSLAAQAAPDADRAVVDVITFHTMVSVSTHERPGLVREFLVLGIALGAVAVETTVVDVTIDNDGIAGDGVPIRSSREGEELFAVVAIVGMAAGVAQREVVIRTDVHDAFDGLRWLFRAARNAIAVDA